jgi:Heterokaryon incompatibility protein (HET)
MRFIETSTLNLVSKRDDEIPSYAILSHTWSRDEEEVTLQEMREILTSRGPDGQFTDVKAQRLGFTKIRDASRVAREDGHEFIWIDTCCIDKTSSAELSEAINSMFRRYWGSAICYTFLVDVGESHESRGRLEEGWVSEMRKSRWFTRGWTLQELVAPPSIDFYSGSWTKLGTKTSLEQLLYEITGVDRDILNGSAELSDFSIAKRMHWASSRKTTRVEDLAYCLMGIFDVNMPLLYGEGAKSFIRLQEEILRSRST